MSRRIRIMLSCITPFTFIFAVFASTELIAAEIAKPKGWLESPLSPSDARHLLARTGFDASPEAQTTLKGATRAQAIDAVIDGFRTDPTLPMPRWTQDTAPLHWTRRDLDEQAKRRFDRTRDAELAELRQWWVDEMLTTPSPQTERMVLFWHDHFATSYHGVNRHSMAMARQNQTFRELGMSDFKTLLSAMIRDPALLRYLNNLSNKRAHPNENLAREMLELFTLGEGHYDESTVREAARALTGYGVATSRNLMPRFNFWQHDAESKTLLGKTGEFNGDDLIDLLLEQPALSKHISTRFWHWLVSDREPTETELSVLTKAFTDSSHRLDVLYRATLESEAFWADDNRGSLIKSPATLLIGTARTLDTPRRVNHQIPKWLALAGQDLFAPPNVSGWQEGAAWITPGRLLNRYSALDGLLQAATGQRKGKQQATYGVANIMGEASNSMKEPANMMAMAPDNSMMMNGGSEPESIALQLASEEFKGPARYRVELLNSDEQLVWDSGERTLVGGWDTVRSGRLESRVQLSWQTLSFPIDSSLLAASDRVRVFFMNDDAGDRGDRNLYVGGLQFNDRWVSPTPGSQSSECTPPNPADAGDLYCNGYVDLDITEASINDLQESHAAVETDTIRYASQHVEWANYNKNNKNVNARIVFQDLRMGDKHWPIFSAWYRIQGNNDPALWLHNQDCWPDCVDDWPDCAWTDERDPVARTLSFSVMPGEARNTCHFDSLTDSEALLVDSLLFNGPQLLNAALAQEASTFPDKRRSVKKALTLMIDRLQASDAQASFADALPSGRYAIGEQLKIVQDPRARRAEPAREPQRVLAIRAANLNERHLQLASTGFSWPTALAPGINVNTMPGWAPEPMNTVRQADLIEQVRTLLRDPAYQVH